MNLRITSRPTGAFRGTVLAAALAVSWGTALAAAGSTASIALDPALTTVNTGDTFTIDVSVLAASNYIGAYDLTLAFGTAGILSLQSVSFAGALGAGADVFQFSALQSFGEVSALLDLSTLQGMPPFDLATLTFKALAGGTTTLSLVPTLAVPVPVGDIDGDEVDLKLAGATITVIGAPPIPEPSTYALMALGLAAVGFAARRKAN